jgi:D-3-phosphoglycerate dehydrogenase
MREKPRVVYFERWAHPIALERISALPHLEVQRLEVDAPREALWRAFERAHVYQVSAARNELPRQWQVGDALLARCPQLLAVSSGGAGYDTVDVDACTRAGVAVVNQAGGNSAAVAEMTIGLMLAVSRRIVESDRRLRTERGFSRESLMGHDIGGKTLGLVGIGHIGSKVAALARAFGMRVLAVDPLLPAEEIRARGAEPAELDALVGQADIVSLHCPLDDATRGMFDAKRLAALKPGALFVSTARGGIHDERALVDALRSGHLAGAGLDVWDAEPPPLDHPLLALPNVVATFHTAGVSHEGRRNVAAMGAEQVVELLRGWRPPRLVNPEVWDRYLARYRDAFGR